MKAKVDVKVCEIIKKEVEVIEVFENLFIIDVKSVYSNSIVTFDHDAYQGDFKIVAVSFVQGRIYIRVEKVEV